MNRQFLESSTVAPADKEKIRTILNIFEADKVDRKRLIDIANKDDETFLLEKKYVPLLNKNSLPVQTCDVLICTVGFRPNPIILTILMLRPKQVYLLHSKDSRSKAVEICNDPDIQNLGLNRENVHLRQIYLTDSPKNYEALNNIVKQMKDQDQQMVVDVTGGVKVMGVSLAAAAFWQRLPVIYLLGEEIQGIIKPFTERLTLLENPYAYFGDTEFHALEAFFNSHNYEAAIKICETLQDTVGDIATLGKLSILKEFIQLYNDWDNFVHSQESDTEARKLAIRLQDLMQTMDRFNLKLVPLTKLQENLKFLKEIEGSWSENKRNLTDNYRLIDIYCAAQRRAKGGNYDDAVARLYRCLEMSATILLVRDWNVQSPKNPDLSQFYDKVGGEKILRQQFKQEKGYDLPNRLGLDAQMALLKIGGKHNSVTGIFHNNIGTGDGDSLMYLRNRSTLAHGTVPISKELFEKFNKQTGDIVSRVVGKKQDFDALVAQATHPQLDISK